MSRDAALQGARGGRITTRARACRRDALQHRPARSSARSPRSASAHASAVPADELASSSRPRAGARPTPPLEWMSIRHPTAREARSIERRGVRGSRHAGERRRMAGSSTGTRRSVERRRPLPRHVRAARPVCSGEPGRRDDPGSSDRHRDSGRSRARRSTTSRRDASRSASPSRSSRSVWRVRNRERRAVERHRPRGRAVGVDDAGQDRAVSVHRPGASTAPTRRSAMVSHLSSLGDGRR